ncbi:MAG: CDP-alcohol phosphatidyltransferase family protein [Tepidisphaeraceae bacterium]|jgi:CDP-diacylglycerol--glycerol-3-phosphate 3-phosphatidyltransferase
MFRHVPNALTASRLVLAGVFFAMLAYYQNQSALPRHGEAVWLNIALIVYLIALATDFLDGYLARRWKVEGAFGRVVDPFVDKVLVLGSFIFFAGKNFTEPWNSVGIPQNVTTITGVAPWMVVVILARELLVTSLRGSMESSGEAFGAQLSGKLKMGFQSATILVILLYVNYRRGLDAGALRGATIFRDACIWMTLAITVVSGLMYVQKAVALFRKHSHAAQS